MKFIKKNIYIIATFLVAFVIMTIAFANQSVFPFGNNQIMIVDSWHQYYPFLQELQSKLTNGGSLFYSWNTGLGSNFFVIMAYYTMSPIYLLSVLFPKEYLREFMLLATILKIAFAGMFFSIYLRGMFKKNDISIVLFGLLYAFCGYAMGYYWNIMWLDSMALLPLIVLGLNRLLDEEGNVLFTVSLALSLICNFYIGYLICEFVLIYFFILYFIKYPKKNLLHLLKKILKIGIYAVISIGIAAVVLIPTYKGLKLGYGFTSGNPLSFKTYFSLIDILNNLLANVTPAVRSGLPNIYCGFFALFLLVFYFISTSISVRTKALNFFLFMFILFSFNINYLNYAWHGFSFPNEIPYRFAFVLSLLMITWSYQAFLKLEDIAIKTIWSVSAIFFVYLLFCEKIYKETFDYKVFYISLMFLVLYAGVILLHKYQQIPRKVYIGFLSCILVGEVILSALNGTQAVGSSSRETYPVQSVAVKKAISNLYKNDDDFYRLEMIKWYSENDPVLYGYRGVSKFSSTTNAKVTVFAQKLGLCASPEANRYIYASSTPIVNALLSIKYLFGKEDANVPNAAFELLNKVDHLTVYQNKYDLPIGFMVKDDIKNWEMTSLNPFEVEEAFVSHATSSTLKVFEVVPFEKETYENMKRTRLNGIRYSYNNIDSNHVGHATLTFTAPVTKQMYVYMFSNRSYKTDIKLNGKTNQYQTRRGQIIDLGIVEEGNSFEVSFESFAAKDGFFDLQVVTFDDEAFATAYADLSDETLNVNDYSDTQVKGTIDVKQKGTLYLSIPYEKGWTAKVDGRKTEIVPLKEAMITLPLSPGVHTIELNYIPDGFKLGLILSCGSVALLAIMTYILKGRKKKRPSKK